VLELETGPGKPRLVLALVPFGGQLNFMPMQNFDSAQPLQFPVRRLMIQSVAKQGKYDEALRMAQDLVNQKNHWLTRDIHAWVLREAGRFADAAKAYEDILNDVLNEKNLDPEDRADYEDRYRYLLSNLYVETKQVQKGIDQLRTLVQRHPNEPGYLNDLGYIMADHDMNLDEAERMIRKALELDRDKRKDDPAADKRDNGAYLDSLGWVLYKQKKYKEAKEHLLKAIEDPQSQHIEIYDHLGDVSMALNEREAALRYWQKGVELASDSRRDQERKTRVMEKIKQHSN
jgi:tetratricopeptide (TPR) repeat protein